MRNRHNHETDPLSKVINERPTQVKESALCLGSDVKKVRRNEHFSMKVQHAQIRLQKVPRAEQPFR